MNWTQIEGKWAEVKGDAKSQWANRVGRRIDDAARTVQAHTDRAESDLKGGARR